MTDIRNATEDEFIKEFENGPSSDEEKYANESFEMESDNEIPEISETESEAKSEYDAEPPEGNAPNAAKNSPLYTYPHQRFNRRGSFQNRDYGSYESSSDDEDDVVISETIAEINTQPMILEDVATTPAGNRPKSAEPQQSSKEEGDVEDQQENYYAQDVTTEPSDVSGDDEVIDIEPKQQQQQDNAEEGNSNNKEIAELGNKTSETELSKVLEIQDSSITAALEIQDSSIAAALEACETDYFFASHMLQQQMAEEDEKLQNIRGLHITEADNCLRTPSAEKCIKELANFTDYTVTEQEDDSEAGGNNEPTIECCVTSRTPTSFNSDDYTFHMNFLKRSLSNDKLRLKAANRKSWSFSNERMREIDRQNQILLKKILTQKPTYVLNSPKVTQQHKFATLPPTTRVTSAAVNRKKQQRQIDLDNQVLKRKIEAISLRRPLL